MVRYQLTFNFLIIYILFLEKNNSKTFAFESLAIRTAVETLIHHFSLSLNVNYITMIFFLK